MFDLAEKKMNSLEFRLNSIEKNQKIMMDIQATYAKRQDWWLKNWWRVAGITLPVLFMLGEISIWIRRLV